MSAKAELKREKERLGKVRAELARVKEQEVDIKKNEQTDALVRALQRSDREGQLTSTERADLCHACTCTKYC